MLYTKTTLASVQETILPQRNATGANAARCRKLAVSLMPLLLLMLFFIAPDVMAGTTTGDADDGDGTVVGEDAFQDIWATLVNWTQGTLGRVISLTLIVVGACMGVVRQSLITFVVGIAMGLALYNAPTIIVAVMGATTASADLGSESLKLIGNGLM